MKRLLAFLVLLSHMNTSMLLPQVPETDIYDANGNQVDDINSIVELVMVKLGLDHRADDEDDDSGQNFHLVKCFEYYFNPEFIITKKADVALINNQRFGEYQTEKISSIYFDVIVPPPKMIG